MDTIKQSENPCTNEKCVECGLERLEGLLHCNCECHFGYTCENCGHEGR